MKPWEFWTMTPHEYNMLRAAFYRRRRRQKEDAATWVTVLVNHFPMRGKNAKTLRVEQLIGYSPEQIKEIERKRNDMSRKKP